MIHKRLKEYTSYHYQAYFLSQNKLQVFGTFIRAVTSSSFSAGPWRECADCRWYPHLASPVFKGNKMKRGGRRLTRSYGPQSLDVLISLQLLVQSFASKLGPIHIFPQSLHVLHSILCWRCSSPLLHIHFLITALARCGVWSLSSLLSSAAYSLEFSWRAPPAAPALVASASWNFSMLGFLLRAISQLGTLAS